MQVPHDQGRHLGSRLSSGAVLALLRGVGWALVGGLLFALAAGLILRLFVYVLAGHAVLWSFV